MKKVLLILAIICLPIIKSCDKVTTEKFRSYVNTYYQFNDIKLSLSESGNILIAGDDFECHYTWQSKGDFKKKYDELCELHNDMSFNKKMDYIAGTDWGHALAPDFISIDVVSSADFDSEHPAGTSLNDIFYLISVSPQEYIKGGYNQLYDWSKGTPARFQKAAYLEGFNGQTYGDRPYYHPIDKKLSEITAEDMALMGVNSVYYYACLVFDSEPTLEKEHELTVTVRTHDGKTLSHKITKVFE